MKNIPLVSIVILCWNRKDDVCESLNRINKINYSNLEVIVVDNFSSDGTQELIKSNYKNVNLIEMKYNAGIEAYNFGFKSAKGDYIIILDDDSFPHQESVRLMVEKFENNSKLGIVAFDVRNYFSYDETNTAINTQVTTEATSKYMMSFNGAGAGIRKSVMDEAGYYPGEFFLYWNEMDLAFRVLNLGYEIQFFSDVISYHKYSVVNRESWRAPYYYSRNAFWLVWKNYPLDMVISLTLKLVYNNIFYSIEQKTPIYLKAIIDAFKEIGKIKKKRNPVLRNIAKSLRVPFETSYTFYR